MCIYINIYFLLYYKLNLFVFITNLKEIQIFYKYFHRVPSNNFHFPFNFVDRLKSNKIKMNLISFYFPNFNRYFKSKH